MQHCVLSARAKVNLFLQILGDRPDGYHEVAMVLQTIDLADRIRLSLTGFDIRLHCDHPEVPTDASNLAYKAAALLQREYQGVGGVEIRIDKRIPVGAGLAGGSADAAAVLVGLNQLWGLGLTTGDLQELGAQLGSDVPFCISGGTMLATGRGELLEPLNDLSLCLLLAKPRQLSVSTPWAYQTHRRWRQQGAPAPAHPDIHDMLTAIQAADPAVIARTLFNDLEYAVLPQYPQVEQLKQTLLSAPALGGMMSGSGPSVFALMPATSVAETVKAQWAPQYPETDFWVTQTAPTGISLHMD